MGLKKFKPCYKIWKWIKINILEFFSGRINSLEWNTHDDMHFSNAENKTTVSKYNEELVTAAQDCLVKFHNLSEAFPTSSDVSRPYCIMSCVNQKPNYLRTVVPVWKAR